MLKLGSIGCLLVLLLVLGVGVAGLTAAPCGVPLAERLLGRTPQAQVDRLLRAVRRGDEAAALRAWELPSGGDDPRTQRLAERRAAVVAALLAQPRATLASARVL
ncbi:MAG: hypothetical protein V1772_06230, partial [Chloroflexota bacterium]